MTSNKKEVETFNINKNIRAIEDEFAEAKKIYNLQHKSNRPELISRYDELIPIIQQGIFAKGFTLDILDFNSHLEIGKNVTIKLEIKIKYNNIDYIIERNHTVLISELLPSPEHHSPGWYAGDNHVHSEEIL